MTRTDWYFSDALALIDDMARISRASEALHMHVEKVSNLRLGELQSLKAVQQGATHARDVARRTQQGNRAARATVDSLIGRDLLMWHPGGHPTALPAGPTRLRVTQLGHAVLQQAEAVRIRAVATLLTALAGPTRDALLSTSHDIAGALDRQVLELPRQQ